MIRKETKVFVSRGKPLPVWMLQSLKRYVFDGIPPGDFLIAVLHNDLKESIGRADENSLEHLHVLVSFCYMELPGNCWGSREAVDAWLKAPKKS